MNKVLRLILTISCVLGAAISFLHILEGYKYVIGEGWAPIHLNIEIEKEFAHNLSIFLPQQKELRWLSPTTDYGTNTRTIVMYAPLSINGFYRGISIRIPEQEAAKTIASIDNISIFIGNKLFYFSSSDINTWKPAIENGYTLFPIPGLHYTNSLLLKNWTNYYGDFNLALVGIADFLFHPARYAPAYFFLVFLLYLYRKQVTAVYLSARKKYWIWAFLLVLLFGFALRINGYIRHSGWSDEIYSATVAGNPNMPFIQTFIDNGNPPFYFILLRLWFKLFGWTEEAGTLLSVILGTLAIPALYYFVKPFFGKKTALLSAFFMSICAFAVGYSQEMRPYILKMFLSPVIALAFFSMLKKLSLKNTIVYLILSTFLVNAHYYGILFVISNFIFFIFYHIFNRSFKPGLFFKFLLCNIGIALSFMPFFLYQIFYKKYYFDRHNKQFMPEFTGIFIIILCFAFAAFYFRKSIANSKLFMNKPQLVFCSYITFIPLEIFMLAFIITFVKPMIAFRYLMPVNLPFFLSVFGVLVYMCWHRKRLKIFCVFLIWALTSALSETKHNGGSASIPGNGSAAYKESRDYIARDAAAHAGLKSAMLDNAPQIAAYYGYNDLPLYSPEGQFDVLYVLNGIFNMHEPDMYEELIKHDLDDDDLLKIRINEEKVVFKKYLR
jgi:hypothetical protein